MVSRVDQIELHVRKLAQATGIDAGVDQGEQDVNTNGTTQPDGQGQASHATPETRSTFDASVFAAASTVTSDLDIEALSKALLDISKDLDHYLCSLLQPPQLPIASVKADITALQADLAAKDRLLKIATASLRKTETKVAELKNKQLRNVYHM